MVWNIIKSTTKYSFYGFSLLASSLFITMLTGGVHYHPLWGSLSTIIHYSSGIVMASLGIALLIQMTPAGTYYRASSAR